jgi:alpha-maltose-1-phosphate synthase
MKVAASPRPLRILLLCEGDPESWDSWSGISRSVVHHLRALGHTVIPGDVDLYGVRRVLTAARQFAPRRRRWWVKYHLLDAPFRARSRRAREHVAGQAERPDVILQFGVTFDASTSGVPVVLYCDGNIALSQTGSAGGQSEAAFLRPREVEALRAREGRSYAGAERILTLSERLRQSFIQDFQVPAERVRTIYAGPNFDTSRIPEPSPAEKPGPPTVLFVGRQFQRKGGDVLLEAFRTVRERIPGARLLIVGPSDLTVDQPGVEVLGLIDKNTGAGWERLKQTFLQAHVFCMPSRYEGLSISFLEAMYFGLPCIGAHTDWSPPEMIEEGRTGLVVPVDDPQALAGALTTLLESPGEARIMGMNGRRRAEAHFNWTEVVRKMNEELEEVVKRR